MAKYLVLFCTLFVHLSALIIEAPHFKDLVVHARSDTLLVLDIDDTLLITAQMLGCDEWFQDRLSLHQQEGNSKEVVLEQALAEWEAVRHLTAMEIVESSAEKIIRDLQAKGYAIMGLTTQGLSLATRTVLQLQDKQIDLSLTAPFPEDCLFQNDHHGVLYRKGILFTSGSHKGKALFTLMDRMGKRFRKIVFLNDKASHLAEVELVAKEREVEFVGLRYAYSDARKERYRSDVADYQFTHSTLNRLMGDEEALAEMSRQ